MIGRYMLISLNLAASIGENIFMEEDTECGKTLKWTGLLYE